MQGTDLVDNGLDGVKCTVYHPSSGGVAGIMSVIMPLLNTIHLVVAALHQSWGLLMTGLSFFGGDFEKLLRHMLPAITFSFSNDKLLPSVLLIVC